MNAIALAKPARSPRLPLARSSNRQVEGVSAEEVDVLEGERRDPGDVGFTDVPSFAGELLERDLDVDRVPQRDGVEGQAEGAKLLLLLLAVGLSDLAALTMTNPPDQPMPELLAVELSEDATTLFLAVDVSEQVQRLDDATQLGERTSQGRRPVLHLKHSHDGASVDAPEFQRSRQSQQVLPVAPDQLGIYAVPREAVQRAVVGSAVDAPEAGITDVGKSRAELVAQKPEQPEHRVGISCGVGHDLGRFEIGFLVEQQPQDEQAVAQGAGHDDSIQSGELVGHKVVIGDTAASAEVLRVGTGVDSRGGRHETDAVSRCHFTASPVAGDRQGILRRHDPGVGGGDGIGPDEVLADPRQARLRAGCSLRMRGSKPMLQAWAMSPPHRLVAKSLTRA